MKSENARNVLIAIDVLENLKQENVDVNIQNAINNCIGKLRETLFGTPVEQQNNSLSYCYMKAKQMLNLLEIINSKDEKFLQDLGVVSAIIDEKLNEMRKDR